MRTPKQVYEEVRRLAYPKMEDFHEDLDIDEETMKQLEGQAFVHITRPTGTHVFHCPTHHQINSNLALPARLQNTPHCTYESIAQQGQIMLEDDFFKVAVLFLYVDQQGQLLQMTWAAVKQMFRNALAHHDLAEQRLTEHNLHNSHWGKRIIKAERVGGFTFADKLDAHNWTTCACGKQDPRIPRHTDIRVKNMLIDNTLTNLGVRFYADVKEGKYLESANTLIGIEQRSIEILEEL